VQELPSPRWDRSVPAELRFPYQVLELALPDTEPESLHFHFTKDAYELPEYGRHVVAVLVQEERCKVPVYGRHVLATVRNCLARPFIGFRPHARMGRLEGVLLFEYARDWFTHLRSQRAQARTRAAWGPPIRPTALVVQLPLGYHSQDELPQVHMKDRPLDVFFAGQVSHEIAPRRDYRRWLSTSKFIAREQLWRALSRLQTEGRWNIDLGMIAATQSLTHAPIFGAYSDKMMHARVCVAPRGSIAETFRAYEGARAGCLVVANTLPHDRIFADSPILQIDHWRELEGILIKYARDMDLLEEARAASLRWWETKMAEKIWAAEVAQKLNSAAATVERI